MNEGRRLLAAIVVLGVAFSAGLWADDPPVPAPHLEVEALIDLGQVVRGKTDPVVFELRNTGDAVLTILDIKPG